MVLSSELSGGILSLAVYLASVFPLVCTFLGVKVMDIFTMFEWCGTVLRVLLKIQVLPLGHKRLLPIVPRGSNPLTRTTFLNASLA